ncbi:MAG: HdeD family acid-resistance protein [Sphingomonadaceae bacterium]
MEGESAAQERFIERLEAGALAVLRLRWWAVALRGLAAVIFGVLAFLTPVAALLSLVIVFGIFAIADGLIGFWHSWGRARDGERWVWLAVGAGASLVIGILALVWPILTAAALTLFIAINAAITGALFVVTGARLDADHGRWWLVAAGVASLLFAVLLFLNPFAGALAITWIIGAWAIVLGVCLLILGFQLKSARDKVRERVARFREELAAERARLSPAAEG